MAQKRILGCISKHSALLKKKRQELATINSGDENKQPIKTSELAQDSNEGDEIGESLCSDTNATEHPENPENLAGQNTDQETEDEKSENAIAAEDETAGATQQPNENAQFPPIGENGFLSSNDEEVANEEAKHTVDSVTEKHKNDELDAGTDEDETLPPVSEMAESMYFEADDCSGKKHDQPATCPKCESLFTKRYNMLRHLKLCSGKKTVQPAKHDQPATCPNCEVLFTKRYNMLRHLKRCSGKKLIEERN